MPDPLLKLVSGLPAEAMDVINRLVDHVQALEREIATLRAGATPAGSYVAVVQAGGIAAAADLDHPGVGNIKPRIMSGDIVLRDDAKIIPAYNIGGSVASGRHVIVTPLQGRPGFPTVIVVPCFEPPAP